MIIVVPNDATPAIHAVAHFSPALSAFDVSRVTRFGDSRSWCGTTLNAATGTSTGRPERGKDLT